jgi:hypothetical protein
MSLDTSVIPIHTGTVKVAISVPDPVCSAVDEAAARLGISRSEFFATAARRYLDEMARASLTASVDEAVVAIGRGGKDPSGQAWSRRAARRTLERNPW